MSDPKNDEAPVREILDATPDAADGVDDWLTSMARAITGGWCCDIAKATSGAEHRWECRGKSGAAPAFLEDE